MRLFQILWSRHCSLLLSQEYSVAQHHKAALTILSSPLQNKICIGWFRGLDLGIQEAVKWRRREALMHVGDHGCTQAGNRAKFITRLEIDKGFALINR